MKMMSKRVLYGLGVGLSLCWGLASCMGDGANTVNYHRVGVVRDSPMLCIYTTNDAGNIFIISSADFESRTDVQDGDCCAVDFETNFEDELTSGIYDADIFSYDTLGVWPLSEELTDTNVVVENERLVTLDFVKSIYLEGRFFLQTEHKNHQSDQLDLFDLSYDPEQVPVEEEDGSHVYNFYLRVAQQGGTGDSTTWLNTSAFVIEDFLERARVAETSAGQEEINFRIHYATGFNADTTACVWGATDTFTLLFSD